MIYGLAFAISAPVRLHLLTSRSPEPFNFIKVIINLFSLK